MEFSCYFKFSSKLCLLICFLIFQFGLINCEKQYEFNCLNKDCSGILFEGFSEFVHHSENDADLIRLGQGEHLKIYGVNDEFYLTQKQKRSGLVKKKYVKIQKAINKDKPLMKIKASFSNHKINLIDDGLNELANNLTDNHLDKNFEDNLSKEQNEDTENKNESIESLLNDNSKEISDTGEQKPKLNAFKPIVQILGTRNLKPDANQTENSDKNKTEDESLSLNNPEIENFSDNTLDGLESNLKVEIAADEPKSDNSNQPTNQTDQLNRKADVESSDDQISSSNQPLLNEQQPSLNEQQPSLNEQQPSLNEQKSTLNEQQPSLNEHQPSLNEQQPILNEQPPLSNEQLPLDNQINDELKDLKDSYKQSNGKVPAFDIKDFSSDNSDNKIKEENVNKEDSSNQDVKSVNEEKNGANDEESKTVKEEDKKIEDAENKIVNELPKEAVLQDDKLNTNLNDKISQTETKQEEPSSKPAEQKSTDQLPEDNVPISPIPNVQATESLNNNVQPESNQLNPQNSKPELNQPSTEPPSIHKEDVPRHPKKFYSRRAKVEKLDKKEEVEEVVEKKEENSVKDQPSSIESDTFKAENTIPDDVPSLPDSTSLPSSQNQEPSAYIVGLRYVLGFFVDMLPDGIVLFLEQSLQISTRLLMFVFIIGLLWIVLFTVKLFYVSLSNETVLKNQLCESQNRTSQIQRERDDIKTKLNTLNLKLAKGLEEKKHEVDQMVSKLNEDNERLKESKLEVDKQLEEQLSLVKTLQTRLDQLNENNSILFKENDELNEQLDEELKIKENLKSKIEHLEELNKELITKHEKLEGLVNEKDFKIDELNEKLEEQEKLVEEKDTEIGCLNKLLNEFKESKELTNDHESSSDEQNEDEAKQQSVDEKSTSFFDVVKLRCEIEKLEKERNDAKEKLKSSLEKTKVLEEKLEKLKEESSENNEIKSKVLKEKEDAEKYLDFLKKYYNENKNDLQKELGVYQYKEKQLLEENKELQSKLEDLEKKVEENEQKYQSNKKEFDDLEKQLRDELLTSNKSACDYFKSAQMLRTELTSVKKDNEYLRQQLRNPSASSSTNSAQAILPPPEMPKAVLEFFGQLTTGQMPLNANGLPNLPNLSNLTSLPNLDNLNSANFITAPSPIPTGPPSLDYQQPNYHSSFSNIPFTSVASTQQSQTNNNLTSMYNPVSTAANNFNQIAMNDSSFMMNQQPDYSLNYAQQQQQPDFHYTSLPNIPYSNQQPFDPRFSSPLQANSLVNNQQWENIQINRQDDFASANQADRTGTNSPHPSLHSNV